MEPTSKSTSNLRTRAFVLLRKLDQNGSLTEAETYELVEIQTDLSTTSVKSETDSFKSIVDARFDSVDHRFDSVDHRFDSVDQRLDSIDKRLDLVDKRFDLVDKRFDSVIKWLKIGITTGIGIILTMGGWLITLLLTGGS